MPDHASFGTPPAAEAWPLVTVVVLVFNQEQYVERCLDSILATAYPALEWIIIDDCSRDGSVLRVEHWLQAHAHLKLSVTFHRCPQNRGIGKNLNQAIAWAHGRYYAPIAADDELLPQGLHVRVRHLEENPELWATFADCRVIDAYGRRLWDSGIEGMYRQKKIRKSDLLHPQRLSATLVFRWGIPGPVMLLRREAFASLGGYSEDLAAEDWDIYLRLASSQRLDFIDAYVANYRVHGANSIFRSRWKIIEALFVTAARNAPAFGGFAGRHLRMHGFLARFRGAPKWRAYPVMAFVVALERTNRFLYDLSLKFPDGRHADRRPPAVVSTAPPGPETLPPT